MSGFFGLIPLSLDMVGSCVRGGVGLSGISAGLSSKSFLNLLVADDDGDDLWCLSTFVTLPRVSLGDDGLRSVLTE